MEGFDAGASAVWGRVDKQSLENCMNTIALALSLVMAGTGDLETLRLLRGDLASTGLRMFCTTSGGSVCLAPARFVFLRSPVAAA